MTTTAMARWNDDVLGMICDDLDSSADLARLARVHPSWTGTAQSTLYRSIGFGYEPSLPLARLLLDRPDIAQRVREIYIRVYDGPVEDVRLIRQAMWACRHVTKLEVWLGKYTDQNGILAPGLADLVRQLPLRHVELRDVPADVIAAALSHDLDWLKFDVPSGFALQGRVTVRSIEGIMSPDVGWSSLSSVVTAAAETLEELRVMDGRWDETGVLTRLVYGRMPKLRRLVVRIGDLPPPFMDDILTAHPQLEALAIGFCAFSERLFPKAMASPALKTLVIEANGGGSTYPIPELESVLRGLEVRDEPLLRVLGVARATSNLDGLRAEADRLGVHLVRKLIFRGHSAYPWPVAEDEPSDDDSDALATPAPASPPPSSSSSASSSAASSSSASAASFPSTPSGASWASAHSSIGSCHAHPSSHSFAVTK